jgi:hypothetical protein
MQVARSGCAFSASGFREMNFLPSAAVATVFCCINFQLKSRARTHPGTLPVLYSACTLLPHLSVTRPLLFTRPPDRLGRGSHFEAPAHTSCMTLAVLLYLARSDLAGDLLGSPKCLLREPSSTVSTMSTSSSGPKPRPASPLLCSPLLFYLIYSAPLSLSLLDPAQSLGILIHLLSHLSSPTTSHSTPLTSTWASLGKVPLPSTLCTILPLVLLVLFLLLSPSFFLGLLGARSNQTEPLGADRGHCTLCQH